MRIFIIMCSTLLLLALFAACGEEYEDGVLDCVDEYSEGDSSATAIAPLYCVTESTVQRG